MKHFWVFLLATIAYAQNPEDPVCMDQKPGKRLVFTVGPSREEIIRVLTERGEDASKCEWVQRKNLPTTRAGRDQWFWNKHSKKVVVNDKIPKSKSQKLRDQFVVLKSTVTSRDQKIDALFEIQAITAEPNE